MKIKLNQAIIDNQSTVMELSAPDLKILMPVLIDVREELAIKLEKIFLAGEKKSWTLQQHLGTMKQIDAIFDKVKSLPKSVTKQLQAQTNKIGTKATQNLLKMAKASKKQDIILRIPAAKIILNAQHSVYAKHHTSSLRYAGRVGERMRHAFGLGLLKGESVDDIATRLLGLKEKSKSAGKNAETIAQDNYLKNKADATRLVRTELNSTYNRIQMDTLHRVNSDDPGWRKMWDATLDLRVCVVCRGVHGEIRPLNANFSCGVPFPPVHPNDRCAIIPVAPP